MGRVWRARDEVLHRDVAIKELVPPPGLTTDERREMRERSLREARAIARLNHINVVRIFDVLRTDGDPWIVMEYVASRSLQDTLTSDGPVSVTRAAEIGLGVLGALNAAHRAGVMHRDVKPGNVLLGEDGRVVLTDFGLATVPGDPNVTRTGLVLGSPAYIAPERARDGTAEPEGDLWSLGATLYAAVEGQSPFARPSAIATLAALATEPPPPAKRAGPLKAVLNGLLRKDPASRIDAATAERLLRRAAGRRTRPGLSLLDGVRRPSPNGPRPERSRIVPLPVQRPPQDEQSTPSYVTAAGDQTELVTPSPPADRTELVTPSPPADRTELLNPAEQTSATPTEAEPARTEPAKADQTKADQTALVPPLVATPVAGGPPVADAAAAPDVTAAPDTSASTDAGSSADPEPETRSGTGGTSTSTADTAVGSGAGTTGPPDAGGDTAPVDSGVARPDSEAAQAAGRGAQADGRGAQADGKGAQADSETAAQANGGVGGKADGGRREPASKPATAFKPGVASGAAPAAAGRAPASRTALLPSDRQADGDGPKNRLAAVPSRFWLVGGVVAVLLLALVLIIPLLDRDEPTGTSNAQEPSAGATQPGAPAPSNAASNAPGPTPTSAAPTSAAPVPPPPDSGNGDPVLPAGWKLHKDSTGFSVPVPNGWRVEPATDGNIYFREQNRRRWFLIGQTDSPEPDPVTNWLSKKDHRRRTTSGYQRVGNIRAVDYFDKAADWEWTYNSNGGRRHTRNRGFITASDKAYAIRWDTLASEWDQNLPNFQIVADGFVPVRD